MHPGKGFSRYTGKPKLICLERAETLLASFLALGNDSQNIESYCLGQRSAKRQEAFYNIVKRPLFHARHGTGAVATQCEDTACIIAPIVAQPAHYCPQTVHTVRCGPNHSAMEH